MSCFMVYFMAYSFTAYHRVLQIDCLIILSQRPRTIFTPTNSSHLPTTYPYHSQFFGLALTLKHCFYTNPPLYLGRRPKAGECSTKHWEEFSSLIGPETEMEEPKGKMRGLVFAFVGPPKFPTLTNACTELWKFSFGSHHLLRCHCPAFPQHTSTALHLILSRAKVSLMIIGIGPAFILRYSKLIRVKKTNKQDI